MNLQLLNVSTQLNNTSLGQPISKTCLIQFSQWCKKLALVIKSKTCSGQSVRIIFGPKFFIHFSPQYEDLFGYNHSLLYFAILTYIH